MNTIIGKKPPRLSVLVDVFSCLIFDMIGLDKQLIEGWVSLPPNYWHTQSCFKNFQKYALIFVSDHLEQSISMMGQYIHRYSDETKTQQIAHCRQSSICIQIIRAKIRYNFKD